MNFPDKILNEIGEQLINSNEKIAVAESVTAGSLQNALSQITNASEFFNGGITAYTAEIKIKLLKVDPEEAEREDCVSKNIAEQMATEAGDLFNAQWSVGITGYATPVPESGHKLFAYYCIIYKGKTVTSKHVELAEIIPPEEVQMFYVEKILSDLHEALQKKN